MDGFAKDPFAPVTVKLRVPIRKGEAEFGELVLQPPLLKDKLRTDGHPPESVAYAIALLSSMTGVPESALQRIWPEDWADICIVLAQTNLRFMGGLNFLDRRDGDPTTAAATPPPN